MELEWHFHTIIANVVNRRNEDSTQEKLIQLIKSGQVVRVGATTDPGRRFGEYKPDYPGHTITFAKTSNMKMAENKLLDACPCEGNTQRVSNAREERGYVYAICK